MTFERLQAWLGLTAVLALAVPHDGAAAAAAFSKTALVRPDDAEEIKVRRLKSEGYDAVALMLSETNASRALEAARQIQAEGLDLDYWIEVARNPELAQAHPEWMASIQTHQEWRRHFPDFGPVPRDAVVKVFPWTPVLYKESFDVHLARVASLLRTIPVPRRLFLSGLQGAPSACGCGHPLCRWTSDYGPLKTATPLGHRAAADFVASVKRQHRGVGVIPVWTTECEAEDRETVCGGVGCYGGACWREWTAQLTPVAQESEGIGVLLLSRTFDRELPAYRKQFGWLPKALGFFQTLPPRYAAEGVAMKRLLPVVQGWDRTAEEIEAQISLAKDCGSQGVIVALAPIDQSWAPRLWPMSKLGQK